MSHQPYLNQDIKILEVSRCILFGWWSDTLWSMMGLEEIVFYGLGNQVNILSLVYLSTILDYINSLFFCKVILNFQENIFQIIYNVKWNFRKIYICTLSIFDNSKFEILEININGDIVIWVNFGGCRMDLPK